MAENNTDNKIVPMKQPLKVKIYVICFIIFFVYLLICIVIYLSAKHVTGYEVIEGSLSVSNRYTGIALRDETIIDSGIAGYVNYFASEGEKVAFNEVVCCVDETGSLRDYLLKNSDDSNNILSDKDLAEIKNEMINFSSEYSKNDFYSAYDFKNSLKSDVLKFSNRKLLSSLDEIKAQSNQIIPINSTSTGIVLYTIDGFERKQAEDVEDSWFDKGTYENNKQILENNAIVNAGDALFKLVDDENWSVVIKVEPERYDEILEEEYVKVRFYKNQYESWAKIDPIYKNEESAYLKLSFTNSMITFVEDRFIDLQLLINADKGLKIPNSAITQTEFYIVSTDFISKGGNKSEQGVMVQKRNEEGELTVEFVETHIYAEKTYAEINGIDQSSQEYKEHEEEYKKKYFYIGGSGLEAGDVLMKDDSTETFTLGKEGTLTGVYNINKGYAEFKIITIIASNEEYSIVSSGTNYGLLVHDYIALDADSVETDDFIYE